MPVRCSWPSPAWSLHWVTGEWPYYRKFIVAHLSIFIRKWQEHQWTTMRFWVIHPYFQIRCYPRRFSFTSDGSAAGMVVIDVCGELRWADGVSCESAGAVVQPKVGGLASKNGWKMTQIIVLGDGLTYLTLFDHITLSNHVWLHGFHGVHSCSNLVGRRF